MRLQLWHVPQEPVVSMVVLQAAPRAGCVQGPLQPVFFLSPFFKSFLWFAALKQESNSAPPNRRRKRKKLLHDILCCWAAFFSFQEWCQTDASLILISLRLFSTSSSIIAVWLLSLRLQPRIPDKVAGGKCFLFTYRCHIILGFIYFSWVASTNKQRLEHRGLVRDDHAGELWHQ